jgi:hypothetical protein
MAELLSPADLADIAASKKEWAVLCECASPSRDVGRLKKSIAEVDWSRLLLLAEEHGVIAHLAGCIKDCNAFAAPAAIKQAIFERQRAQCVLTLALTAELFRLLDGFAARGIPFLAIKGPVLAMQAYGDPSMRSYGDLDLLVRQQDIRRATEVMMASGYHPGVTLEAIDAGKIPGQYLFSKPDSKLLVELHNDRTLRYFPRPLPIEDYFARQMSVRIDSREVPAPTREDELVLVCIHGAKHFWEKLAWVADVAGLVSRRKNIDWERAAASARAVDAEHLLHTGLRLAAEVLRTELPPLIADGVQQDAVAAKLAARVLRWLPAAGYAPPGLLERAAFRLHMRGDFFAAPAYLLRLSFSPTEEDWQAGGQLSPNRFLKALRRPFRLARKYGRRGRD